MPFPTTSVIETFDGTGSGLGANWTADFGNSGKTGFDRSSGTGVPSAAAQCNAWYNVANFGPDCESFVTFTTKPNNNTSNHLYARMASEGTTSVDAYSVMVRCLSGTDAIRVFRLDDDVHTQLGADISQEFSAGDSLGMRCTGSATVTIQAWYKAAAGSWTLAGSRTDSTYTAAGKLALLMAPDGSGAVDNYGGGRYVPPPHNLLLLGVGG